MKRVHNLTNDQWVRFSGVSPREALISVAILHHPTYGLSSMLSHEVRQRFAEEIRPGHRAGSLTLFDWAVMDDPLPLNEAAEARYPGVTYDAALPQAWVDRMAELRFDVRGHFVTLYPEGETAYCAPITDRGVELAARIATIR